MDNHYDKILNIVFLHRKKNLSSYNKMKIWLTSYFIILNTIHTYTHSDSNSNNDYDNLGGPSSVPKILYPAKSSFWMTKQRWSLGVRVIHHLATFLLKQEFNLGTQYYRRSLDCHMALHLEMYTWTHDLSELPEAVTAMFLSQWRRLKGFLRAGGGSQWSVPALAGGTS